MRYRLQQKRETSAGWYRVQASDRLDDLLDRLTRDVRLSGHLRIVDIHDRELVRVRNKRRLDGARKAITMNTRRIA